MAETVGRTLKSIRKNLGFLSARSFYMALQSRSDLQFNYSYYMKIEADQIAPSEKVINQLAALLPQKDGDLVVAAYCHTLFPKQMARILNHAEVAPSKNKEARKSSLKSFQQELTERQIARIAKSQDHYFLFLILTLAREPLSTDDLKAYDFKSLPTAIEDLRDVKLILEEEGRLSPGFPEYVFPKADSASLKAIYQQLDSYDQVRHHFFNLKKAKLGSFFKRISPRQSEIILGHLELLFQTIRAADETDVNYNTEVISLNLSLHKGALKG